jgi:ABC-type multidrug transport system ATPase subunit
MTSTHHISPEGGAIAVSGLARRYGADLWALAGASFQVDYGTVFALLGRNGSGKTTTVRILTTLTLPTAGTASVAGFDVVADAPRVRNAIGVTMQAAALDPEMTGREHLELICGAWGDRRRQARDHADELLTEFGLTAAADRIIGTYSGGMQRRLDIAGALANRPRVLFLDEPTTGLDAQSRRALWDRVRALRSEGAAVFLTTQYLEEADTLADTVAVLDGGRIIATGSPSELKSRFSTTTVRLRSDQPATVESIITAAGHTAVIRDGWIRVDVNSGSDAVELIHRVDVNVTDISVSAPTLEDAYLSLTGETVERTANDFTRSAA